MKQIEDELNKLGYGNEILSVIQIESIINACSSSTKGSLGGCGSCSYSCVGGCGDGCKNGNSHGKQ